MNQTITEVQELHQYAAERLQVHLNLIASQATLQEGKEHRKRIFNEHLIIYIDELNQKCKEISGGDCGGNNKSLHAVVNDYQGKFMSHY